MAKGFPRQSERKPPTPRQGKAEQKLNPKDTSLSSASVWKITHSHHAGKKKHRLALMEQKEDPQHVKPTHEETGWPAMCLYRLKQHVQADSNTSTLQTQRLHLHS